MVTASVLSVIPSDIAQLHPDAHQRVTSRCDASSSAATPTRSQRVISETGLGLAQLECFGCDADGGAAVDLDALGCSGLSVDAQFVDAAVRALGQRLAGFDDFVP